MVFFIGFFVFYKYIIIFLRILVLRGFCFGFGGYWYGVAGSGFSRGWFEVRVES